MILSSSRTRAAERGRTILTGTVTPDVTTRRGRSTAAWIALGVAAVSVAAPLIRLADAPALVVALYRDLLALAGAAFAAVYMLAGRVVRRRLPLLPYVTVTYATAAALLLPAVLLRGDPLTGFGPWRWAALVGLGLGPQVLGHTVFNFLLGRLRADAVAVAVLGEPIGASILALVIFGEVPPLAALPGALAVLAGIWLTLRDAAAEAT